MKHAVAVLILMLSQISSAMRMDSPNEMWTTDTTWDSLFDSYTGPPNSQHPPGWYRRESAGVAFEQYIITSDDLKEVEWQAWQLSSNNFRSFIGIVCAQEHTNYIMSIPEPATIMLLGMGWIICAYSRRTYGRRSLKPKNSRCLCTALHY